MDENQSRARKDNGSENFARLRRLALDIIRTNQDKGSTRGKNERAAWDDAFLLELLAAAQCNCLGRGLCLRPDREPRDHRERPQGSEE